MTLEDQMAEWGEFASLPAPLTFMNSGPQQDSEVSMKGPNNENWTAEGTGRRQNVEG